MLVTAGLALAAYGGLRTLRPPSPSADIRLFEVARRDFPVVLQEKGELKAANSIRINCELEGRATIIELVEEGTLVKKGDLLVQLASDQIEEQIRESETREATADASYEAAVKELQILKDENASKIRKGELAVWLAENENEKYNKGNAAELRQDANLALERAKYVLRRSEEELKDSEELYEQGFITRIELENDKFDKYTAEIELKKATLALEVIEKYTIPMAVEENESDLEEAKKELDRTKNAAQASEAKAEADVAAKKSTLEITREKLKKLRDQMGKAKILAPADGLVVYSRDRSWGRSDRQIETGAQVYERQELIELPDTSSMKVVVRVHEAKTEKLKVGLPAKVTIEGFSGEQFTGTISKIGVLADSQNRWLNPNLKEYETEILLEGTFERLKPGATARVEIMVAAVKNALAVPVQAVFGKGGRYYVFVDNSGNVQPVQVEVGLASNEYAEITSGLTEGQKIRMSVTDEMKLQLPDVKNGPIEQPDASRRAERERRQREPRQRDGATTRPTSGPARAPQA